jgi:hypothetical protein
MSFNKKWNDFKEHMISEGYEDFENENEDMVKDIKTALIAVGFDKQTEQTKKTKTTKKTGKKRGPSGYNLFMKDMAKQRKETGEKGNVMAVAGPVWNAMSPDEKKVWNDKAKALAPAPAPATEKTSAGGKKKKISGYNLFLKEMFAQAKKDGQKGDMKAIGAQWKGLTDAEKKTFNTRAVEISAQTAAVA